MININGIARSNLRSFLKKIQPNVILLQETKFRHEDSDIKSLLRLNTSFDLISSSSVGLLGGTTVIWGKAKLGSMTIFSQDTGKVWCLFPALKLEMLILS